MEIKAVRYENESHISFIPEGVPVQQKLEGKERFVVGTVFKASFPEGVGTWQIFLGSYFNNGDDIDGDTLEELTILSTEQIKQFVLISKAIEVELNSRGADVHFRRGQTNFDGWCLLDPTLPSD